VIPQTAVRPSEKGFLAYVVEDGIAHERVLTLGMRTASGDVEVKSGLKVGESVVVRGAEALRDGVKVKIESPAAPGAS
jgi:multidrug efflux pump subunit AcrA (membrane-fusion protein)